MKDHIYDVPAIPPSVNDGMWTLEFENHFFRIYSRNQQIKNIINDPLTENLEKYAASSDAAPYYLWNACEKQIVSDDALMKEE